MLSSRWLFSTNSTRRGNIFQLLPSPHFSLHTKSSAYIKNSCNFAGWSILIFANWSSDSVVCPGKQSQTPHYCPYIFLIMLLLLLTCFQREPSPSERLHCSHQCSACFASHDVAPHADCCNHGHYRKHHILPSPRMKCGKGMPRTSLPISTTGEWQLAKYQRGVLRTGLAEDAAPSLFLELKSYEKPEIKQSLSFKRVSCL